MEGEGYIAAAGIVRGLAADPAQVRRVGLAYLAIAEHIAERLVARRSADEAQVQALTTLLAAEGLLTNSFSAIARELVTRGVRVEVTE